MGEAMGARAGSVNQALDGRERDRCGLVTHGAGAVTFVSRFGGLLGHEIGGHVVRGLERRCDVAGLDVMSAVMDTHIHVPCCRFVGGVHAHCDGALVVAEYFCWGARAEAQVAHQHANVEGLLYGFGESDVFGFLGAEVKLSPPVRTRASACGQGCECSGRGRRQHGLGRGEPTRRDE